MNPWMFKIVYSVDLLRINSASVELVRNFLGMSWRSWIGGICKVSVGVR